MIFNSYFQPKTVLRFQQSPAAALGLSGEEQDPDQALAKAPGVSSTRSHYNLVARMLWGTPSKALQDCR